MPLIFPKDHEFRITGDPLWSLYRFVRLHGFDGKKKYFWIAAAILKAMILLGRTVYAYQTLNDSKKLTELVATYPVRFMAVWKMFYLYLHKRRVSYLFDTIKQHFWDFHIAGPTVEKRIMKRCSFINLLVWSHITATFICLTLLVLFPLVEMPEGIRPLPNIIWTPFDTNPSPFHELFYFILLWNLILSIAGNAFYDIFYVYCVQHLFVQYTLLKHLLSNITHGIMEGSSDIEKFNSEYFQRTVMDRLRICVKQHVKLLRYGRNIEKFSETVLVPQLIMSYTVLVLNGYILSVNHSDFAKTVMVFNLTGSCIIQLALFAIQASDIKEQSISVINAIAESEWYLFKTPLKKAGTFLMLNAGKGTVITAAGMTEVDNAVLVKLIQKALSAITLLRALIGDEDKLEN